MTAIKEKEISELQAQQEKTLHTVKDIHDHAIAEKMKGICIYVHYHLYTCYPYGLYLTVLDCTPFIVTDNVIEFAAKHERDTAVAMAEKDDACKELYTRKCEEVSISMYGCVCVRKYIYV